MSTLMSKAQSVFFGSFVQHFENQIATGLKNLLRSYLCE